MTADGGYPRPFDEPTLESLTSLAFVAGGTTRLQLGVGVLVLPYRNPLIMAKVLATLDILSGGRLVCGLGLGWLREEFDALQVPFGRRRARLEEGIELMRRCWESSPVEYHGEEYRVDSPVHFVPRPSRTVPLYFGGNSDAAVARAARLGNGWIGHELRPEQCTQMRQRLQSATEAPLVEGFQLVSSLLMNVPGVGESQAERFTITSTKQLGAELSRFEDAGLDLLLCETTVRSWEALSRLIEHVHAAGATRGMLVS